MILAAGFGWLKQLLFANELGPVGNGNYAIFVLIYNYGAAVFHIGLKEGMLRQASVLLGNGQEEEAKSLCNLCTGSTIISSLLLFALYIPTAWLLFREQPQLLPSILWGGAAGVTHCLFIFSTVELRIFSYNIPFSLMVATKAILNITMGYFAIRLYGLKGLFFVEFTVFLLLFWVSRKAWLKWSSLAFSSLNRLKAVLQVGVPQMLSSFLVLTSFNAERWFVLSSLGMASFGQYSFGMTIVLGGFLALSIVQGYIGPSLLREYGANKDPAILFKKLCKISMVMTGLAVMGWISLFALVPLGLNFFNHYSDGLNMMFWVAPGVVAQMANYFPWMFIAAQKTYINLMITGSAVLVALALSAWGSINGKDIFYFASIYTICRILELSASLGTSLFYFGFLGKKRIT